MTVACGPASCRWQRHGDDPRRARHCNVGRGRRRLWSSRPWHTRSSSSCGPPLTNRMQKTFGRGHQPPEGRLGASLIARLDYSCVTRRASATARAGSSRASGDAGPGAPGRSQLPPRQLQRRRDRAGMSTARPGDPAADRRRAGASRRASRRAASRAAQRARARPARTSAASLQRNAETSFRDAPSAAMVANSCRRSASASATKRPIAAAARRSANASSILAIPLRSTVVIELTVCAVCCVMSLTIAPDDFTVAATRLPTAEGRRAPSRRRRSAPDRG